MEDVLIIDGCSYKHGERVTCDIDGQSIIDAKLSHGGEDWARHNHQQWWCICHNNPNRLGTQPDDTFGYMYGWAFCITDRQGITNLRPLCNKPKDL